MLNGISCTDKLMIQNCGLTFFNSSFLRWPQRSPLPKTNGGVRDCQILNELALNQKHHMNARAGGGGGGGGGGSPSNSQRWHAYSAIDLAFIHSPCVVVRSPTAISLAERGPLPCSLISIFLSCLSYYRCYKLIFSKEVSICFYWRCLEME